MNYVEISLVFAGDPSLECLGEHFDEFRQEETRENRALLAPVSGGFHEGEGEKLCVSSGELSGEREG